MDKPPVYNDDEEKKSINDDLLSFERRRRKHLFYAIYGLSFVVIVLYAALLYWVYKYGTQANSWHTTLLLALAPTSLTFALLRILSNPENHNTKKEDDINMLPLDTIKALVDIISKIKN